MSMMNEFETPKKYDRETLKRAAWFRGNLDFKLHSAQRKIEKAYNASKATLFVANCSRQLGKSYWAVKKAEEIARKIPKAQIRYGAAFQSDLIDYIIPAFRKLEEDCPHNIKSKYLKAGSKVEFYNGSVIKLVGLDKNPDGLRGNTLDLILLDEVGFVSELDYIYKSIILPATLHRPEARVIMISTPPATPAHEFVEYAHKAMTEDSYVEITIDDNPLIDQTAKQKLIAELGGIESTTAQRELYCKFVVDSELKLIPEWKDDYIIDVERDRYYELYHKYVGMDLGRVDHTALIFGYYDFKKAALIIQDELTMVGNTWTTETLKIELLQKEKELWGEMKPYRRISDNNNEHLIVDLRLIHDIGFNMTDKESLEAMLNEVRLFVSNGRIIVNPKCKQLIGCLKYGIWDDKRKAFGRSKVYGHYDMLAALVYLIRNLNQSTNPIPHDFGFDSNKSWIISKNNASSNAKKLSELYKIKG